MTAAASRGSAAADGGARSPQGPSDLGGDEVVHDVRLGGHRLLQVLRLTAGVVLPVEFFVLADRVRGVVGDGGRHAGLVDARDAGPLEGAFLDGDEVSG